jgi:broad specificity phosphatase PhoE
MEDTKVTTVLMVRHADVHNPQQVIYGRLPRFRLSDFGVRQAREVAGYLASQSVSTVYSSPQLRARQTARVIAGESAVRVVHISRLIDEVLTGHQGKSGSILNGQVNFYEDPVGPADETIEMIADRMGKFLERMRRRHAGETVVGVSHADPIMILRARVIGLPMVLKSLQGRYYPGKCSVMEFRFAGNPPVAEVSYHTPVSDATAHPPPQSKRRPKAAAMIASDGHTAV